ncbi:PIG-L deacetylase family protein [Sphingomonas abietis]|uniref:PIG-L family deacetylase n=1 Tax=Sphingomonas abietis TaxID=3012344 RepID=A0ABY7NJ08_9SPHN|nr:PIG-L family deacetylase [Sphingomonas abietis]WBO21522.1 PIG-L family deacetylase [Sphingomonas abietis]
MRAEPLTGSVWARARWVVIAPHPDDETLGAGALIAQAAAADRFGGVVYLTDGTGSHPAGTPRLASIRRAEARTAIHRLIAESPSITRMGWQDARPHDPASARFDRDARRLGALLRRSRIDAVAVTGPSERHCDHVAAYWLAEAAIRHARRRVALFLYGVWGDPPGNGCRLLRTRPLAPGIRRRALAAHRSQLSLAYGAGFRLPRAKQRMPPADILWLREPNR